MSATRRRPQILIDHIDLCPSQLAGTLNQSVLQPLAFQIVLDLTGRRLANIHASSLGQLISAYFVHRPPPRPLPSPALLSTASVRGLLAVLPPSEVAVHGRNCRPRIVAPVLLLAAASRLPSESVEPKEDRYSVTRWRRSSRIERGSRGSRTISIRATVSSVIHTGKDNGNPFGRRT